MLQQQWHGGDFVGFLLGRLLPEYNSLPRRPGGNQMQGIAAPPPVMAAPRGFPIDRDDVRVVVAQSASPGEEAGFEQVWVQCREHIAQRVVAGDVVFVTVKPPEERQMPLA